MLELLVIVGVFLFFGAKLLPRIGSWLGGQSRKPLRQAKWMWSWLAGTEAEALQAEHEYGRECARQFAAQFSGKAPREKEEVVAAVGSKLSNAVKDPRREFRFTLVRANTSNAYALPGGFVFITEPLFDLCAQDRDELAFLLGHEMGHILRGQETPAAHSTVRTGRSRRRRCRCARLPVCPATARVPGTPACPR